MTDNLSSSMNTMSTGSELLSRINDTVRSFASQVVATLQLGFEAVSAFGGRMMKALGRGAQSLLTDVLMNRLRQLRIHLRELVEAIQSGSIGFSVQEVMHMSYSKEAQLVALCRTHPSIQRTFGWYIHQELMPLMRDIRTSLPLKVS